MNNSVEAAVLNVLQGLGLDAAALSRTMLIRDGLFVGIKYLFDGGYAICLAGKNVIEVYDNAGELLYTVGLEESDKKDAA